MKNFLAGFSVAALVGTFLLYAQGNGLISIFSPPEQEPSTELSIPVIEVDTDSDKVKKKTRKSTRRKARERKAGANEAGWTQGDGEAGDSLESGAREINGGIAGGEQQLSSGQIEAGIDRGFAGIERCLMLMPPDAPSKGRVVVGMNIAPTGQVTRVNLKGTNAMISGECGACIQRIVKSLKFPSFNGPDMITSYPIDFD